MGKNSLGIIGEGRAKEERMRRDRTQSSTRNKVGDALHKGNKR